MTRLSIMIKLEIDGVGDAMVFVAEGREKVGIVRIGESESGGMMDSFCRFFAMWNGALSAVDGVEEFFGFGRNVSRRLLGWR